MATQNQINLALSGSSGTGSFAGTTSPTFVTPILGTPTSGNATNMTVTGGLRSFQIFTSGTAATYTKPSNVTSILVECIGGGSGGGGVSATAAQVAAAGGGGAGGYCRKYYASAATSYTYTVGTGGAGGSGMASTATTNSVGGNGGVGGGATGGDLNYGGLDGTWGMNSGVACVSGTGGSSIFGTGGHNRYNSTLTTSLAGQNATTNSGGGGGGAVSFTGTVDKAGGNGAAGIIIVWEFS